MSVRSSSCSNLLLHFFILFYCSILDWKWIIEVSIIFELSISTFSSVSFCFMCMRALFLGAYVIILTVTRIFSHVNEDEHPSDVMHRELLCIPSTFSMKIFCDLISFLSIYIYKCIFINLYIYICLYIYIYMELFSSKILCKT